MPRLALNLRASVRSLTASARQTPAMASRSPECWRRYRVARSISEPACAGAACGTRKGRLGTAAPLDEHQFRGRGRQRLARELAHQIQRQMHVGRARGGGPAIAIAHHEPVGRHLDVRERLTEPVDQPPARRRASAGQQARLREQHCAAAAAREDLRAAGHAARESRSRCAAVAPGLRGPRAIRTRLAARSTRRSAGALDEPGTGRRAIRARRGAICRRCGSRSEPWTAARSPSVARALFAIANSSSRPAVIQAEQPG